jgi:hypothetical protein
MTEPVYQKLKPGYRLSDPYHRVSLTRFILGTQDESGKPTTSERRMVWFGEGRLESQVMLCAGRLLHVLLGFIGPKAEALEIKHKISNYVASLGLTLSDEKTLISRSRPGLRDSAAALLSRHPG